MTSPATDDQIRVAVTQLRRLGVGSSAFVQHVKAVADREGVTERTVYRWLASHPAAEPVTESAPRSDRVDALLVGLTPPPGTDPDTQTTPSGARAGRFEIDTLHLTVYAHCGDAHSAWQLLKEKGLVTVSYPTFMRALARTDPARVAGALDGYPGVVANRQYLRYAVPHRNHTYHCDHTPADVWVLPSHRATRAIRPHLTVIVDAFSGLTDAYLWAGTVGAAEVTAALAEFASKRDYHGVTVGGIPEQLVSDNGAENLAATMLAAARNLGWIFAPTQPYSSWQNGKAERAVQLVNSKLSARAPGFLHGGTTREKGRRFVASSSDKAAAADQLWTLDTLRLALVEVVDEINTTIPMKRHGGATRLEAYAADPTAQRFVSDTELRAAMLATAKDTYRATKSGIHFDRHLYVGHGLQVGRAYEIRHLPNERDFIEVFTKGGEHVARAWRVDRMPEKERLRLLAERAQVERENKAITTGAIHYRDRVKAAGNEAVEAEGLPVPDEDHPVPPDVAKPRRKQRRRDRDTPAPQPLTDELDTDSLTELFGETLPD